MNPTATPVKWGNPEVLRQARMRLNLTPEHVAVQSKHLGKFYEPVTAQELEGWEKGRGEPSLEQLETLSEIYYCPVGYFFRDEFPPERLPLNFRALSPGKHERLQAESHQALRWFLEMARWTSNLINDLGIEWQVNVGNATLDDPIERVAAEERKRLGFKPSVRKSWGDRAEAFRWWRSHVEDLGVFCFERKLALKDIRGASVWEKGGVPCILVNHQDLEVDTGRTFTLLHEYAHLLLKQPGFVCDFSGTGLAGRIESFANKLAAEILLPKSELAERLKEIDLLVYRDQWSDFKLDEIRQPLFVSRHVIALRLQEMELAPPDFYNRKKAQWENRTPGWPHGGQVSHRTLIERKFTEIGYSLSRLLSSPRVEQSLSLYDASGALGIKIEQAQALIGWLREGKQKEL
ncbi:MAG: ImmA/IrrE family metallo-endopeptidase [bacterium]